MPDLETSPVDKSGIESDTPLLTTGYFISINRYGAGIVGEYCRFYRVNHRLALKTGTLESFRIHDESP